MDLTSYESLTIKETYYEEVSIEDLKFDGDYLTIEDSSYGNILITDTLREALSRYVGISSSINRGLYSTDKDLWYKVLVRLYKYHSKESVILLLEEDGGQYSVKGLCGNARESVTTKSFIDKVVNYYSDTEEVTIKDIQYDKDITVSTVCISLNKSYTDSNNIPFNIGVVFVNDELYSPYCRLALIYDDGIYYMPSKLYNLSSSRYDRTTSGSMESLEMLLLRVYEDLKSEYFDEVFKDIYDMIKESGYKFVSRAEYERIYITLSNACASSDMSEEETMDILNCISILDDYEKLYGSVKGDYLWKCTAIGGTDFYTLLKSVRSAIKNHAFYLDSLKSIRELLGEYLAAPRVCQLLAKKR